MEDDNYDYYQAEDLYEDFSIRSSIGHHDHATEAAELLNNLLSAHAPLDASWTVSKVHWTFDLQDLSINVSNEDGFAVTASSSVMPRRVLDPLRTALRHTLQEALHEPCFNTTSFAVLLLQLSEEAGIHMKDFAEKSNHAEKDLKTPNAVNRNQQGWDAGSVRNFQEILYNPYGVDLSSVNDTAKYILGKSITDICKDFPDEFRILHVEPVFRADLVSRFLQRKQEMKEELMKVPFHQLRECVTKKQIAQREVVGTPEGIAEYLTTPQITFHGAPRHVVSSIVRYGFVVPGQQIGNTEAIVQVRCGATYGQGIYSSPSHQFACFYGSWSSGKGGSLDFFNPSQVPGFRVIVCAVLMGRPLEVTRGDAHRESQVVREGAHSHVSPNRLEYIVFDKAQIVPCYVLHLDFGSEAAGEYIKTEMKNPSEIGKSKSNRRVQVDSYEDDLSCPGARKAHKQALKAAAAKWFPYGYGPSSGTNFVIEEIGEVSDDEEEFGDFQALRGEQEHELQDWHVGKSEKRSWFDEYQYVRHTKDRVHRDMG